MKADRSEKRLGNGLRSGTADPRSSRRNSQTYSKSNGQSKLVESDADGFVKLPSKEDIGIPTPEQKRKLYEQGIFLDTVKTRFGLTQEQWDEWWRVGHLSTPPPNWKQNMEMWTEDERIPDWHEIKQDTKELVEKIQQLGSEQALGVMQALTKQALPAKKGREELEQHKREIDTEILRRLKRPTTKYELLVDVPKEDVKEVVSRLLTLVRSGQVKPKRSYEAGTGYVTYYSNA